MIVVAAPGFGPSLPWLPRREHKDDDSGHPHQCPCRGLGRSGAMAKSTKRICQRMVIVAQILGPSRSAISWSCVSLVFGLVSETRCTASKFSLAVPGAGHAGSRGGKAPTMSFCDRLSWLSLGPLSTPPLSVWRKVKANVKKSLGKLSEES